MDKQAQLRKLRVARRNNKILGLTFGFITFAILILYSFLPGWADSIILWIPPLIFWIPAVYYGFHYLKVIGKISDLKGGSED